MLQRSASQERIVNVIIWVENTVGQAVSGKCDSIRITRNDSY